LSSLQKKLTTLRLNISSMVKVSSHRWWPPILLGNSTFPMLPTSWDRCKSSLGATCFTWCSIRNFKPRAQWLLALMWSTQVNNQLLVIALQLTKDLPSTTVTWSFRRRVKRSLLVSQRPLKLGFKPTAITTAYCQSILFFLEMALETHREELFSRKRSANSMKLLIKCITSRLRNPTSQ
jgi:hypothetical protein